MAYISVRKTVANLPKRELKLLFGLKPQITDPVPKSALEPSLYQIRASSGKSASVILQKL
jgi:hypothetical protein